MSNFWLNPLPILRAIALGSFLGAAVLASAADGGFSSTLSAEQKSAAGLATLTPEERNTLDGIVAAEVAKARKEGSDEFESSFALRRTDEERKQTGLDRLTTDQLAKLNAFVATAVGAGPKPKERPRIRDTEIFSAPRKPEVHGELSLTYGRVSGGGDFREASMWVDYFDPNSGLGLSVGISQFSGDGRGLYPDYGYGSYPFYGRGYNNYGVGFRSFGPTNYYEGQGPAFLNSNDWNDSYYRDFRRR